MGKRLVNGETSPAQVVDELHDAPAQCRRAAQGADERDGLHSQVLLRVFLYCIAGTVPKNGQWNVARGRIVWYTVSITYETRGGEMRKRMIPLLLAA